MPTAVHLGLHPMALRPAISPFCNNNNIRNAQAFQSGPGDTSGGGGAVLVFLPGAPEISRLQRALLSSDKARGAAEPGLGQEGGKG